MPTDTENAQAAYQRLRKEMYEELLTSIDNSDWNPAEYKDEVNALFRASGFGGFDNSIRNIFSNIDRHHKNIAPANMEYSGLTFITRPSLGFTSSNIRQDRLLAPLDTMDASSIAFAIRCMLDTKFERANYDLAAKSPLLNVYCPFMIPLCNCLTGISGFPDIVLETKSTEGGFFSEDQTYVMGYDRLNRTYDLTLNIKDIQGGPVSALIEFWINMMADLAIGTTSAYTKYIEERRMCYSVSIYRFVLDPSRSYITRFAKATGCFPVMMPSGTFFNVNDYEFPVTAIGKFSTQFKTNKVEYNDFAILNEFNRLAERYCPAIKNLSAIDPQTGKYKDTSYNLPHHASTNFVGLPYIDVDNRGPRLVFKDYYLDRLNLYLTELTSLSSKYATRYGQILVKEGHITEKERISLMSLYANEKSYTSTTSASTNQYNNYV